MSRPPPHVFPLEYLQVSVLSTEVSYCTKFSVIPPKSVSIPQYNLPHELNNLHCTQLQITIIIILYRRQIQRLRLY